MKNDVLCLGIIVGDFIAKPVEGMPERGKLTLVGKTELHIGGCATNTGIVLKKLGVNVSIMGKVGNDNLGKFIINKLKEEGINTEYIKISEKFTTSGTSVLVHSDGERSFLHSVGSNSDFSIKDIDFELLKNFSLIHIAGPFLMPNFIGEGLYLTLKKIKEMEIITTVDTVWDPFGKWFEGIKDSLPYIDYFFVSFEEGKMISGEKEKEKICEFFISKGVKNVCLKMGENGSYIINEKERYYFPALKVNVVDTTGAGDGYVAGFIKGLVENYSFEKCGLLANIVGAKITTEIGATSGVKDWEDLLNFAKNYGYEI
ncbi:MAG: carbohydrate kinase family protein [Candidatus Omnitrophica bacterium]|nr:carbohydrate kinase family protein [Candidatus Omnitrophota bacterium]MCM8807385.1 carbohydrate kinase family protein [Candidatus Omnitrophota bacterium]